MLTLDDMTKAQQFDRLRVHERPDDLRFNVVIAIAVSSGTTFRHCEHSGLTERRLQLQGSNQSLEDRASQFGLCDAVT